jgi:hypothetical protein
LDARVLVRCSPQATFLDSGNLPPVQLLAVPCCLACQLPYTADGRMRWPALFSTWKKDDFASFFHQRFKFPIAFQVPNHLLVADMCYQLFELYSACRCLYYQHAVDRCAAYGRPGHGIQTEIHSSCGICLQRTRIKSPLGPRSYGRDQAFETDLQ